MNRPHTLLLHAARSTAGGWPLLLACAAAWPSAGCSIVDPAREAANGCSIYASDTCQRLADCGPAFLAPYATLQDCTSAVARSCTDALSQPDVLGSGAGARACGELMRGLECADVLNRELPPGCQTPRGRRSDGAPCSVGAQCASGRCAKSDPQQAHGRCREIASQGQPCVVEDDCARGLICTSNALCTPLALAGQACGQNQPCRAPLVCTDGSCVPPLTEADEASECLSYGEALCAHLAACSVRLLDVVYGDFGTCSARNQTSCLQGLQAPDAIGTAAAVAACTRALRTIDCRALFDNDLPAACQGGGGMRELAQPCALDAQCRSGRCARPQGAACGVCSLQAQAMQPCSTSSDCAAGLDCTQAGVCGAPAGQAEACDAQRPCAYGLVCVAGSCSTPSPAGAECDAKEDRCDPYAGLMCDPVTTSCAVWQVATSGQPCGYTDTGWALCTGGASCVPTTDGSSATCQGPIPDGSPCSDDMPVHCLAPASCIDGVCALPSSAACP